MAKVAVPVAGDQFSEHFGAAEGFLIFESQGEGEDGLVEHRFPAPAHQPGAFPAWLRSLGVSAVLAGGMGPRAQQMLHSAGIDLVLGISGGTPRRLVESYLKGELVSQGSSCEGHHVHLCHGHDR